jgi:probable F420-dependent oxidoreductase
VPRIGITIPGTTADATSETALVFARHAEAAGVHSVWATDRLMFRTPEPLITLAAVAAVTSRVRLGTSVLLGSLRRPVLLAKAGATLDDLSGGRLILGLGVGSRAADFAAAEVPLNERGSRMDDLLAVLRLAWSGQPIEYRGRHSAFHLGPMELLPPQGAGLPIWFGGSADAVLRRVATVGDGFIGSTSGGVDGFRARWATIRRYADEAGRDPTSITPAALIHFSVDSDRERARDAMRDYLIQSYGPRRLEQGLGVMVGTPVDLVAGARAYFDAGVEVLILTSITAREDHLDRLLEQVLPKLELAPV